MYADAYLAQTDGAYSAACGRRVPSRQKPQALSMTSGLLRRTGSRPCSRPAGSLSVLFFGGCEVWWSDGRVVGHQRCAGWLQGLSFFVVCWEMVWHRRCAGCGWGEFFWRFIVRGLGIEAVLDRVWCFCVIFKFIFGVFWIIIMEKDGWPDWLTD